MSERGRFVNPYDVKLIDLFTRVKLVIIYFVHDECHIVVLVVDHFHLYSLSVRSFTDILNI